MTDKSFEQIVDEILDSLPPGLTSLPEDLKSNLRIMLQNRLTKLQLVPREEFDAQKKVLLRTREKLEILTKRVSELEQGKDSSHHN